MKIIISGINSEVAFPKRETVALVHLKNGKFTVTSSYSVIPKTTRNAVYSNDHQMQTMKSEMGITILKYDTPDSDTSYICYKLLYADKNGVMMKPLKKIFLVKLGMSSVTLPQETGYFANIESMLIRSNVW